MNTDRTFIHHKPQLVTDAYGFSVSSIKMTYSAGGMNWNEDETCVFNDTWGTSIVVASYDEHDKIVNTIKFIVENFDSRDMDRFGELGRFVLDLMDKQEAMDKANDLIMKLIED